MPSEYQIKQDIIEIGRRLYNKGFVASNDGNISVRIGADRLITTPTGLCKGFLTPDQLVICDLDGKKISGNLNPSSEIGMHLMAYLEREDIKAVVHAHPPAATGFAVAGIPLSQCVLPEVIVILGEIPIASYGTPGTPEISEPIRPLLRDHDAILMENHGAITVGPDVMKAYYKMETLEHFARIAFIARMLGRVNVLSEEEVEKLVQIRQRFGIPGPYPGCELEQGEQRSGGAEETKIQGDGGTIDDATIREIVRQVITEMRGK